MRNDVDARGSGIDGQDHGDTQLHLIRDLMLAASRRGAWLTLGEIAGLTEIGEASISAQLRHLRKQRHGGHAVEKRRRKARLIIARLAAIARRGQNKLTVLEAAKWEYRVSRRRDEDAKDELTIGAAGVGAVQTPQGCAGGRYAEAGA